MLELGEGFSEVGVLDVALEAFVDLGRFGATELGAVGGFADPEPAGADGDKDHQAHHGDREDPQFESATAFEGSPEELFPPGDNGFQHVITCISHSV